MHTAGLPQDPQLHQNLMPLTQPPDQYRVAQDHQVPSQTFPTTTLVSTNLQMRLPSQSSAQTLLIPRRVKVLHQASHHFRLLMSRDSLHWVPQC